MSDSILYADGLYHVYESKAEDGNVVALRGLHIDMKAGEAIAVVGPSGSGKSTLMKCLGGLMKPSAGSVSLAGKNMTRLTGQELVELRQKTVSFIFQAIVVSKLFLEITGFSPVFINKKHPVP